MSNIQFNDVELKIIQYLFRYKHKYLSSQRIAEHSQVSSKTVRKYIKLLNNILEKFDANIEMKRGSGYRLVVTDDRHFYQLLDLIQEQKNTMEDTKLLTNNDDRERFILNLLLLENKQLTLEDLVGLMFISKSVVSTVIQMIKKRIKEFDLTIAYDTKNHITINGEEANKRRFILSYFFSSSSLDSYVDIDLIDNKHKGFSVETIFIIVLEKCREYEIQLSDFVLQNLVLHIALAIKRNEKGFTIDKMKINEDIEYSKELFVAKKIVVSIENLIDVKFPKNEAKYIALHLKSKSNNKELLNDKNEKTDLSLQTQITNVLMQLQSQSDIFISIDQQLIMGIKTHFEPLLTRLKLKKKLKNPLLDEIKQKYSKEFNTTKEYFSRMPILSNYEINDHEWSYISLHILAAMERYKQEHKMNIIVICATGLGSAQMLKTRLENEFSANINISEVISYYQLNDEMLENIDLIVSTIDISASFYNIPVIKVSVFLDEQDIHSLKKYINKFNLLNGNTSETEIVHNQIDDLFNRYFNKERFIVFNSSKNRDDILEIMIQTLTDADNRTFYEDLKNQIHIREQFGTLAFTENVAFPHPAQPIGVNSEIVIGLVPDGLKWDSEHQSVRIIVLMSPSKIENKGLDKINEGLANLIRHEEKINLTLKSASYEKFKQLFMEVIID